MAVYIYRSTDTSAPVLNGTAGTLINVLDACLVNGYGDKSSIGQSKPFSGTNVAMYRMKAGTSQAYLGIDDTGTNVARMRMFTDVSSTQSSALGLTVGTLTQFHHSPTDAAATVGSPGGEYAHKSNTTTAVARPQVLVSNGKIFYLQVDSNSDLGINARVIAFGDFESYKTNDLQPTILIGTYSDNGSRFIEIGNLGVSYGHWLLSRWDGLSWSENACKIGINGLLAQSGSYIMGQESYWLSYPDPIKGGMILSPIAIVEVSTGSILRGRLPGIQAPCHARPFSTGDTITGATGTQIAGRTFEAFRSIQSAAPRYGCFLIETSDTQNDVHFK